MLNIFKIVISCRIFQSIGCCCNWTVQFLILMNLLNMHEGFRDIIDIVRIVIPGLSFMWLKCLIKYKIVTQIYVYYIYF